MVVQRERFAVGDAVTWTSQAGGHTTTKTGVVERVVPPRADSGIPGSGFHRAHESYVVKVGRSRLYWPVASLLRAVESHDTTADGQ